jgi:hypothetical protein
MAGGENKEGSSEDGPGCPKIDTGQTQLGRHALAVRTFCWAEEGISECYHDFATAIASSASFEMIVCLWLRKRISFVLLFG